MENLDEREIHILLRVAEIKKLQDGEDMALCVRAGGATEDGFKDFIAQRRKECRRLAACRTPDEEREQREKAAAETREMLRLKLKQGR